MKYFVGGRVWFWLVAIAPAATAQPFSEWAWEEIRPLYEEIRNHPFNLELAGGNLPAEKFDFYRRQDAFYLSEFARAIAVLGSRLDTGSDRRRMEILCGEALSEVSVVPPKSDRVAPATARYISFLAEVSRAGHREELAAALLPCFWIYLRLAEDLKKTASPTGRFFFWIARYASPPYRDKVESMIELVDRLAQHAAPALRPRMLEAFTTAARRELDFWQSAYRPPTAGTLEGEEPSFIF